MTKGQGKSRTIPKSNIPLIGASKLNKDRDVALINTILNQIDPVMQKILEGIDGLERRVSVVEEIRQFFPKDVNVTIKHDYPNQQPQGFGNVERRINKEEKK